MPVEVTGEEQTPSTEAGVHDLRSGGSPDPHDEQIAAEDNAGTLVRESGVWACARGITAPLRRGLQLVASLCGPS